MSPATNLYGGITSIADYNAVRGKITRFVLYTVRCAHCPDEESDESAGGNPMTQQAAERTFRAYGWRKRAEGWVCPDCCDG